MVLGVDAREFPGGLLRLDPAFAYAEPPSSLPLPRAEFLTLAPGINGILDNFFVPSLQNLTCTLQLQYPKSDLLYFKCSGAECS